MTQRITIDPITRLEGHGKIEIFLDDAGEVSSAYFQVPELRGFESFCVGRHAEEMPNITNRICGVCPEAHHMAAIKAVEAAYGVECLPAARRIRELIYHAFFVADHTTHFYCMGGPDFIVGPDAPASERSILGVIRKVGLDVGGRVIAARKRNHELIKGLGGRGVAAPAFRARRAPAGSNGRAPHPIPSRPPAAASGDGPVDGPGRIPPAAGRRRRGPPGPARSWPPSRAGRSNRPRTTADWRSRCHPRRPARRSCRRCPRRSPSSRRCAHRPRRP